MLNRAPQGSVARINMSRPHVAQVKRNQCQRAQNQKFRHHLALPVLFVSLPSSLVIVIVKMCAFAFDKNHNFSNKNTSYKKHFCNPELHQTLVVYKTFLKDKNVDVEQRTILFNMLGPIFNLYLDQF